MEQRHRDPRPGAANRVAERDGPSVDVQFLAIKMQLAIACQHLRGEGLIEFDQLEVSQVEAVFLFHLADRRHRPDAHDARVNSRRCGSKNSRQRFQVILLDEFLAR